MSKFTIKKLPDESIVIAWMAEDFTEIDAPIAMQELLELLETVEEPVFYIGDVSNLRLTIGWLIKSADQMAEILKHPKIRGSAMVVKGNKLMEYATIGLNSDAFGNLSIAIYDTVDDALSDVRAKIAEAQVS